MNSKPHTKDSDALEKDIYYRSIYENIMDAVLFSSPEGKVLKANQAACDLFGMSEEEICRLSREGLVDLDDSNLGELLKIRKEKGKACGELRFFRKDGTQFPAKVASSIFKDPNGEWRSCIILNDLTDIRLSEQWFSTYFNHAPIAMSINSPSNEWMEVNQEFCRMLGYTHEEFARLNWRDITHPDDIPFNEELIQSMESGKLDHFRLEKRYFHKDGRLLYVTMSMLCFRNLDGSINRNIASVVDNTESHYATQRIIEERYLLRTLVDHLPFPIYVIDKEGRKVLSNKADLANIGCTDEAEVMGKTDLELFPGDPGIRGHADNLKVLQTGTPIMDREEFFRCMNGEVKWLHTTKIPVKDIQGNVSGLVGIGLDVTRQRSMQLKLEESELYFRTLFNLSPDGILVTDMTGSIELASEKIYEMLCLPDSFDIAGQSIFRWVHPANHESAIASFQRVVVDRKIAPHQVFRCIRYDRKEIWVEFSSMLLSLQAGTNSGIMIVCRDITERIRAEQELLEAKRKAEESDRLKTIFLQNLSHEIRTPMNGFIGFLNLLEDQRYTHEQRSDFQLIVQRSGKRLLDTINDLIESSRIVTGEVYVVREFFQVHAFFQEQYQAFMDRVSSKCLSFNLKADPLSEEVLFSDKVLISNVLSRLVDNAVKFTAQGGSVELGYTLQDDQLVFHLSDTGIGIPEEKTAVIFEAFVQLEQGMNRRFEGSGLGLSISKSYIELLGGRIWVQSRLNAGSTFYCSLPCRSVGSAFMQDKG